MTPFNDNRMLLMMSDSSQQLSNLIELQSQEINRVKRNPSSTASSAHSDVAGFMDYDPKEAALLAYKKNAKPSLKRNAPKWFHL